MAQQILDSIKQTTLHTSVVLIYCAMSLSILYLACFTNEQQVHDGVKIQPTYTCTLSKYLTTKPCFHLRKHLYSIKQFIDHMVKLTSMDFGSFQVPLPGLAICLPHFLGKSCVLKEWSHNSISVNPGRILSWFINPFVIPQFILTVCTIIFGAAL